MIQDRPTQRLSGYIRDIRDGCIDRVYFFSDEIDAGHVKSGMGHLQRQRQTDIAQSDHARLRRTLANLVLQFAARLGWVGRSCVACNGMLSRNNSIDVPLSPSFLPPLQPEADSPLEDAGQ
jgi:hypothetical protein